MACLMLLGAGLVGWTSMTHGLAQAAEASAADLAPVKKGGEILVPERSPLRSRIAVQSVSSDEAARTLSVPANVEADPARTANILPPLTGKVVELKVHLGDQVKKGQVLATLSSGDFGQAASDLGKARDAVNLNQKALDRARKVFEAGGSATKDVEQATSNVTQAQEEFRRAQERMVALGGNAKSGTHFLTLTAPMAGSITALAVAPGAYVNDTTVAIMTISNLDSIWFTANVPEDSVSLVSKGQRIAITLPAYPGDTFKGSVAFVSAVLDPDSRSDKVRIAFDNREGKFKPNMFANVSFTIPEGRQISVPASALIMNNDSTTVFVEVRPWIFVRRTVDIGDDEGEQVPILKGLTSGERVIVKGGVLLND
jgi:cobalt-zinc-cadmium efflux system membrane fusion protein